MTRPVIIHHMAALDGHYPPNSLEAVRACLEAKAPVIEVDIVALARDDYLLVHDETLESETTGSGPVEKTTPEDARTLFLKKSDGPSNCHAALLRDVVQLFRDDSSNARLQLDFKNVRPMTTTEPLERLIKIIEPLGPRVIVSSCADWQLRRLRKLAPWLDLGFDVQFYLDWRGADVPGTRDYPPFRRGAYGYFDDHLLASEKTWPAAEYLAERYEIMSTLVPRVSTFYIEHKMLVQSLYDGFNVAEALHSYGIVLDAWTLDADKPVAVANARRLKTAGVDFFTSNTPAALAEALAT